jgi:hypothetical protein
MANRSIDLAEHCREVSFVVEYEHHFLNGDGLCEAVSAHSATEALEWGEDRGDVVSVTREPLFDRGESARTWLDAGYSYECEACSHRVSKYVEGIFCDDTETGDGVIVGERVYCSQACADGRPEEHEEEEG